LAWMPGNGARVAGSASRSLGGQHGVGADVVSGCQHTTWDLAREAKSVYVLVY
jgi:hypothetical protein